MTAWFASGVSLFSLVRPVLRFAVPLTVLAMVCSVWLTPWAKAELDAAKDRFAKRSDVSKVSAGQFRESGEGNRVFFVERQSEVTKQVENVFVVDSKGDTRTVVSAARGSVEVDANGQPYLVLSGGRRATLDGTGERYDGGGERQRHAPARRIAVDQHHGAEDERHRAPQAQHPEARKEGFRDEEAHAEHLGDDRGHGADAVSPRRRDRLLPGSRR